MPLERERALVARSRDERPAFAELYAFYLPRIHAFVYRRLKDRSVTEDITASTFEKAFRLLRTGEFRNDSFSGWLYRVAENAVIDHVRRSRRTVSLRALGGTADGEARRDGLTEGGIAVAVRAPQEAVDDPAAEALVAAVDRDELRRALARIPEHHRRVLVLRFFDDLDIDELCAALGCSRATLAVKVHRALRALRGAILAEVDDVV